MLKSKSTTNKKKCEGGCGLKILKHGAPTCGDELCLQVFEGIRRADVKKFYAPNKKHRKTKTEQEAIDKTLSISKIMDRCQTRYVNPLINYLDRFKPCVSCGRPINGKRDAGHFLAKAASSGGTIVRFNYDNINTQCHQCNTHTWDKEAYRAEHARRYGEDKLNAVCNIHAQFQSKKISFKPTREWVAEIQEKAKQDLKIAKADDSFVPENNHYITIKYMMREF